MAATNDPEVPANAPAWLPGTLDGELPAAIDVMPPHQRSLAVLPEYAGVASRIGAAVSAAAGRSSREPVLAPAPNAPQSFLAVADTGSALQRARRSWRATEYEHRLDLLIQGPHLRRSVT